MSKIKLPKKIKDAVRLIGKYNGIVIEKNNLIRDWMAENNLANDGNLDQLIDCLEIGNDAEAFIKFMESDDVQTGNSRDYY